MEESLETLSSGKKMRTDLMNVLSKSHKGGSPAVPSVVSEAMRILEMIRHFQGDGLPVESAMTSSVRDALHLVLRAMHYEFPMQNITISKFLPPDLGAVPLRREHLETIFFQLLHRARQVLSAGGGMIIVKVREKDYPPTQATRDVELPLPALDGSTEALLSGRGMSCFGGLTDPDNRHKKTFMIEVSDSQGRSGEGAAPVAEDPMSLALVTSLVEYYGGVCRVDRAPRGTAVVVEIPT